MNWCQERSSYLLLGKRLGRERGVTWSIQTGFWLAAGSEPPLSSSLSWDSLLCYLVLPLLSISCCSAVAHRWNRWHTVMLTNSLCSAAAAA